MQSFSLYTSNAVNFAMSDNVFLPHYKACYEEIFSNQKHKFPE